MANHLREWLECVDQYGCSYYKGVSRDLAEKSVEWTSVLSQSAVCFDAGSVSGLDGFSIVDELVRLPYPVCWIEFREESDLAPILFSIMAREIDGGIEGTVWVKKSPSFNFVHSFVYKRSEPQVTNIIGKSPDFDIDAYEEAIGFFKAFLSALNCRNIKRVEHKPDAKLQKARAKRGKQPLFSYWTLELDLTRAESSESLGGTHASPRLHLRRGHPRQYAPGKWTWVQPCAVGNKKAGMVHKDYAVRAPQ